VALDAETPDTTRGPPNQTPAVDRDRRLVIHRGVPLFQTHACPQTDTFPVSPLLFSHPAARSAASDVSDADLRRARQVDFSAAATIPAATTLSEYLDRRL
jgi:hypothetical protein